MNGRLGAGLAGAAVLIGGVTVVSRVVGFGRWLVFSHTVGATCLGDAYNTANMIPNIVFEIVAGGALASVVVPLVAGPLAREARQEASAIASALITWSLAVLTPLSLVGMLLAGPLTSGLLEGGHGCGPRFASVVARMLLVFLPQVPLYGVAVVASGLLQSSRRFLAPAAAPLVSSLVVIAAYATFGALGATGRSDLSALSRRDELVLSVGTTLGVLVLAASLVPVLSRTGLVLRPTLQFPPGVAARARSLAGAGVATLLAQQLAAVTVLVLSNSRYAPPGALTVYTYTWAVYLLPYAVLAVPIATSAFTALSAHVDAGEHSAYATTVAATSRAVLLVSSAGAGVLAATALPVSRVFLAATGSAVAPPVMARALVLFAPGLLGYGMVAHLGRALYAAGHGRASAAAVVAGWAAVVVADLGLVAALPRDWTVAALGLGNTVGMSLAGALLLAATVRSAGAGAVTGLARSASAGVVGALAGYAAGTVVEAAFGARGPVGSVPVGVLCALAAGVAFGGVVMLVDSADARLLLKRRVNRG